MSDLADIRRAAREATAERLARADRLAELAALEDARTSVVERPSTTGSADVGVGECAFTPPEGPTWSRPFGPNVLDGKGLPWDVKRWVKRREARRAARFDNYVRRTDYR